ncbi:MBL fold metallo-hydrolase [Clostridium manihotivorum]|uniref:MBL fold metallo-hydrolase n=1 Tax=Clostridium manihotivorum TaxID=2320868 RepID=A0A410DZC4_9CLOT|nr:MBL fold metallo-hydrolase [Clostridium manihotivorum]QAA34404.1 MBL fold metallo-hydrolase [Clostridium manihotivorum]
MEITKVLENVYKFNHSIPNVAINFNQYLVLGKQTLLAHTGNVIIAKNLIPELKKLLGGKSLNYIFVSHFESDECGGINLITEAFPEAEVICSNTTEMQFKGFGFSTKTLVKKPEEVLEVEDLTLKFIKYPSEMHLWEGILAIDTSRNMLFSSDLFIHWDTIKEQEISSNIEAEINNVTLQQVPSPEALEEIKTTLSALDIKYIACGHGPFITL